MSSVTAMPSRSGPGLSDQQEVLLPSLSMRAIWPSSPTSQRAPVKSSHTMPLGSNPGGVGVVVPSLNQGQLPSPPPMFVPVVLAGQAAAPAGPAKRAKDRSDVATMDRLRNIGVSSMKGLMSPLR